MKYILLLLLLSCVNPSQPGKSCGDIPYEAQHSFTRYMDHADSCKVMSDLSNGFTSTAKTMQTIKHCRCD
jgi:hypothetical protein